MLGRKLLMLRRLLSLMGAKHGGFVTLGIESSCDDTALAVIVDGGRVIADAISSQIDSHSVYGASCRSSPRVCTRSDTAASRQSPQRRWHYFAAR